MTELKTLSKLKLAGKLHYWRGTIEMPETELHAICDEIQAEHEQAIAATLDSGMCENANTDGYGFRFECSECGYSTIVHNCTARLDELPRFCPSCGRKVVSADD